VLLVIRENHKLFDLVGCLSGLIDAALVAERQLQLPRDYLGASRIGEPCARKLVYELKQTPIDDGKGFSGQTLRIFDAGHALETPRCISLKITT
jgi:hypothetical protein